MTLRRAFLALVFLCCAPALAAGPRPWLVIVYMAADNDLSPYAFQNLYEMEGIGSSDALDVVVFHDEARPNGLFYYHLEKNPAREDYRPLLARFIEEKKLQNEEPAFQQEAFWQERGPTLLGTRPQRVLPEGDSGDERTLGEFLRWALETYPAERTLFLGWSHGDGFDAKWDDSRRGGFAFDQTSGSHMTVNRMALAVREALARARGGEPFDIAGSEACLNQQLEIGFEWLGLARFLFGSSTLIPKKGFDYERLLAWLAEHASLPTREIAAAIPGLYAKSVVLAPASPVVTMATWDVAKLPAVGAAASALGEALTRWLGEPPKLLDRLLRAERLKKAIQTAARPGGVAYDASSLFTAIAKFAEARELVRLAELARAADGALDGPLVANWVGVRQGAPYRTKGASVWVPESEGDYTLMFEKYRPSRFYTEGAAPGNGSAPKNGWAQFVERLYSP